ncbi:hypothetical protein HanRHA438_Chr03g0113321 [Helianthus annuus]|nr:hypothetical protein HanRHA438_Chr03g0113321 [Helianthus annuus]
MVANIDLFHFYINPHVTHALVVAHMVRMKTTGGLHSNLLFYQKFKSRFAILDLCIINRVLQNDNSLISNQ